MRHYLINFFKYNNWAFCKQLDSVRQLPDKAESVKLLSHLINSQNKWLNRISNELDDKNLAWSDPIISMDELESKWDDVLNKWMMLLEENDDSILERDIVFSKPSDGKKISVKIRDIILQINYHSIHHRAQISRIIRQQGLTPPATDYIFTVLKEL
jgi:uncharacterized damage-inducible protein DinB